MREPNELQLAAAAWRARHGYTPHAAAAAMGLEASSRDVGGRLWLAIESGRESAGPAVEALAARLRVPVPRPPEVPLRLLARACERHGIDLLATPTLRALGVRDPSRARQRLTGARQAGNLGLSGLARRLEAILPAAEAQAITRAVRAWADAGQRTRAAVAASIGYIHLRAPSEGNSRGLQPADGVPLGGEA